MANIEEHDLNNPSNPIQNEIAVLAKGSGISLVGKLAGRGLQLLTHIVLARGLGPTLYGLYTIGWTVLQIGSQVGLMGLENGVIHFGGRAQGMKDETYLSQALRHSLFLALISGLLVGGGIYLSAPYMAVNLLHQEALIGVLRDFGLALTLYIGLRVTSTATRLSRRMQFSVLAGDIVPAVINIGFVVLLVYMMKRSLHGALIAVWAGFGIGWLLAFYYLRQLFPGFARSQSFSLELFKQLLFFSLPTFLAGMVTMLMQSASTLLIGYFRSPAEVGVYQAAVRVSMLSGIILVAFNAIFAPMIPALHQARQKAQLNELFKVSTKWALYSSLPLFLIIIFVPHQVMELIYGEAYAGGAWPLAILSCAQLVSTGTGAVGFLLIMTHHEKRWLLISAVSFLLSIVLNLALIPLWGIRGAALATGVGIVASTLIALFQVKRRLGLWPYDRRYLKGVLASLASALVILVFKGLWVNLALWRVLFITSLSIIAFTGVLFSLGMDEEERSIATILARRYWRSA
ncbi:MAG: flippase [Deltaproteobacteria bacterium]|nr:flippase [Deltaproteobacteria bacterium]